MPVADGLLFGGCVEGGIDRVARIKGGIDDKIGIDGGVEATDVVDLVDRVDNLHRFCKGADLRGGITVGEDDLLAHPSSRYISKEVLESVRIV